MRRGGEAATHTDIYTNCSMTLSECRTLNTGRNNKRERGEEEETVGERGTEVDEGRNGKKTQKMKKTK